MIVDYHMHLRDRPGGEARGRYRADRAEEYVEQARSAGVDEIGFTDHVYYFRQSESLWEIGWMRERCMDDLDEYVDAVEEAKRRGLPVKLGLEVDYFPGIERELAALLEPYPWDYLLGSVHFVDGFPVDQEPGLVHKLPVGEAWRRYFVWLRNAARSGLFDVLSHPDLIKFFGPRPDPSSSTTSTSRPRTRSRPPASASRSPRRGCTSRSRRCTPTASCSPPVTIEACRSPQPRMHTSPRTSAATSIAPWSRRARPATTR